MLIIFLFFVQSSNLIAHFFDDLLDIVDIAGILCYLHKVINKFVQKSVLRVKGEDVMSSKVVLQLSDLLFLDCSIAPRFENQNYKSLKI